MSDSLRPDCSPPGSSVRGISKARKLQQIACSFPRVGDGVVNNPEIVKGKEHQKKSHSCQCITTKYAEYHESHVHGTLIMSNWGLTWSRKVGEIFFSFFGGIFSG